MKKVIVNESQFRKIQNFVNESMEDEKYQREVAVDIYYRGKIRDFIDEITAPKITLSYLITIEAGEWGIKDISLYNIKGPSEIDLEVSYYPGPDSDDLQVKTVKLPLDWEKIEVEKETTEGVITVGAEITLDVTENEKNELICTNIRVPIYSL